MSVKVKSINVSTTKEGRMFYTAVIMGQAQVFNGAIRLPKLSVPINGVEVGSLSDDLDAELTMLQESLTELPGSIVRAEVPEYEYTRADGETYKSKFRWLFLEEGQTAAQYLANEAQMAAQRAMSGAEDIPVLGVQKPAEVAE